MDSDRVPDPEVILVLFLVAFGAWYASDLSGGVWLDHVMYARAAWSTIHGNPYTNPTHMFAPVGRYVILVGQVAFGPTPFGSRVGVVLVGLATLAGTYALGRRVSDPLTGLAAVALLGATPLFASHAVAVMFDMTLTLAAVALVLAVSSRDIGRWDAALVGCAAVLTAGSKSYGVLYVVGPAVVFLLRLSTHPRRWVRLGWATVGALLTLVVAFAPYALTPHPDYYAGATLPSFVLAVFDIPFVGNVAYAFAASLYHNLTRPASSAGTGANAWWLVSHGGLVYVVGLVAALLAFWRGYDERDWTDPRATAAAVGVAAVLAVVALPKSYPRYLLPAFPALGVLGVDAVRTLLSRASTPTLSGDDRTTTGVVILAVLAVTVAPLYVGYGTIHYDSGFDDAADALRGTATGAGDPVVLTEQPHVLRWHLGDKVTEQYYYDPTAPHRFDLDGDGRPDLTVIGVSPAHDGSVPRASRWLEAGNVTYTLDSSSVDSALNHGLADSCSVTEVFEGYSPAGKETLTLNRTCG